MTEESTQIIPVENKTEAEIEQEAPGWYVLWRERIRKWIHDHTSDTLADILLFVPDMFMLTVGLIRDKRVPFLLKAQLILAAAYVLSPFDLLPEALTGVVGLADDAGVLALTLYWLRNVIGIDRNILRENWIGEGDVITVIDDVHQRVNENANKLFSGEIWTSIHEKFSHNENEENTHRRLRDRLRRKPKKSPQLGKYKQAIEIE